MIAHNSTSNVLHRIVVPVIIIIIIVIFVMWLHGPALF